MKRRYPQVFNYQFKTDIVFGYARDVLTNMYTFTYLTFGIYLVRSKGLEIRVSIVLYILHDAISIIRVHLSF